MAGRYGRVRAGRERPRRWIAVERRERRQLPPRTIRARCLVQHGVRRGIDARLWLRARKPLFGRPRQPILDLGLKPRKPRALNVSLDRRRVRSRTYGTVGAWKSGSADGPITCLRRPGPDRGAAAACEGATLALAVPESLGAARKSVRVRAEVGQRAAGRRRPLVGLARPWPKADIRQDGSQRTAQRPA